MNENNNLFEEFVQRLYFNFGKFQIEGFRTQSGMVSSSQGSSGFNSGYESIAYIRSKQITNLNQSMSPEKRRANTRERSRGQREFQISNRIQKKVYQLGVQYQMNQAPYQHIELQQDHHNYQMKNANNFNETSHQLYNHAICYQLRTSLNSTIVLKQ
ncbi:hypothetical protein OXYTRIMIC_307 [Oxytricha trifallax]|uniref:Uncharacterized protein n=1 Tax=Oxytricha trifallax TaxID=1172189 RepID=A0A073IB15_9SPIT|nr:hypothetical protein OXYTRIMIC_307 [Oxytricha trifallax]